MMKLWRAKAKAVVTTTATEPIPTWWNHHCAVKHRTYTARARCEFGEAGLGICGSGPYVTVPCWRCTSPVYSAYLHKTERAARETAEKLDNAGCGDGCRRNARHRVARLELAGRK